MLAEVGYDRLTMDAVAARARAAKTTIYRRWRDKAELVVDSLNSLKGVPDIPDSGSLREDLRALAESITSAEGQFGAQMTIGMVNALAHDAELRRVFGEKFIAPRMAGFRTVLERAVVRGEMPGGHDLDLLMHTLTELKEMPGPVLLHVVTKKGKGYGPAESDAGTFHGVGVFDPETGTTSKSSRKTYTQVFGETALEIAAQLPDVVAVTAAMTDNTGLKSFASKFPDRFFDVGMAEEHGVTFSAGLAAVRT